MKLRGMACAWFREADWPRWCEIDSDFQPDYAHWLRRMETALANLKAAGTPTIKVTLDPDEFLAWSRANNAGVGTYARATFAGIKAMELDDRERRR